MLFYSSNHQSPDVSLAEAVIKGLAPDNGLYMPERIPQLPASFFDEIPSLSFQEIAFRVASAIFGDDIPADALREIVFDTLSFPCPVVEVSPRVYSLELFHGPTLAFKDVGARFMARLLRHFLAASSDKRGEVHVLAATSGDTGSAVANGFLGVDGIRVHVLYPKGKVSAIQESQFATLGRNVTAIEVDGTFDDCQALVKQAFLDTELNSRLLLTSANSINVARFLPQMFYYFEAYAQLRREGILTAADKWVVAVPSGNFGNLTAGLIASRMGLPVSRFIAAGNANRPVPDYLASGVYTPRPSVATIANAMDVGAPSNFARILDLFSNNHDAIAASVQATVTSDSEISETIRACYDRTGYLLDPHGATAYRALTHGSTALRPDEIGTFLETAHPAKFVETVGAILGDTAKVPMPERLIAFTRAPKLSIPLAASYPAFRTYLQNL